MMTTVSGNYESIEKSVPLFVDYPKVEERYFHHYYFVPTNVKKKVFLRKSELGEFLPKEREALTSENVKRKVDDFISEIPHHDESKSGEIPHCDESKASEIPHCDESKASETPSCDESKSDSSIVSRGLSKFSGDSSGKPVLEMNDTHVMMHSNRICVVGISHRHPILKEKKEIVKVDYSLDGINRLANKVSGKGKRGGQIIGCFSPICKISCSDGTDYTILAGTRGKLIELNERLLENPNLVTEFPSSDGYLAVILPKIDESEKLKKLLLSYEEYEWLYSSHVHS